MRTFLQNIYQVNIDQIVTAVMNEYTDYRHTGENKMTNRDTLLDIFSDARVAAPVLKAASLHAEAKEANQAYLYVFKHVTKKGYYSEVSSTETLETVRFLFLEFNHMQGAAEPNQIFTCSIDGVGQSFSEKNECCFLRQIN